VKAAPELLCAPTMGGGSAWLGGGGGESNRSKKKPSMPPEIYENGEKTGGFMHFLAYKLPKTPFFTQKYLTRYNLRRFLRNT
jgi:hypothetical protein